jgi:hypothetical protein
MADSLPTIYYRYFSDSRSGPHRRLGIGAARDVKLYGLQVVRLSHRLSHGVRIPASGRRSRDRPPARLWRINAHATASSGNKPSLLVTHDISLVLLFKTLL